MNRSNAKHALGLAVIDEVIQAGLEEMVFRLLREAEQPVTELLDIMQRKAEYMNEDTIKLGCPLNNLMQETSPLDEAFKARLTLILKAWQTAICNTLVTGQRQRQIRATVDWLVSQENHCDYCVGFNAAMLINKCGLTPEQVAMTRQNPEHAPLNDKDKAMLLLVLKAVSTPDAVGANDLQKLRSLGWSDSGMLDAVSHGARNRAVDVIFNAFKVENDFQEA